MKTGIARFSSSRRSSLLCVAAFGLAAGHTAAAMADSAYITQAVRGSAPAVGPTAITPLAPRASRPVAFVPTPEAATASAKSINFAQTLEIGRSNQVAQFQAGQNNLSNVGVVGGSKNAVGVFQGGSDLSNLYLVNTQGLAVGVLQPKGAAPSNVLIARLPNGALLIKK